jgi:hypothetical protein
MCHRGAVGPLALLLSLACVDLGPPMSVQNGVHDGGREVSEAREAGAEVVAETGPPRDDGHRPDDGDALPDPAVDADEVDPGAGSDGPPDAPLLPLGEACTSGAACLSGTCVDGVCCDTACAGTCQACNVGGAEGTCTALPGGMDPADECALEPAASCGHDGSCDGAGACRLHATGLQCAAGTCVAGTETAPGRCDGKGTCVAGASRSCAPNVCASDSCAEACAGPADCQSGYFCEGGMCHLRRGTGAACGDAGQCASGMCVDGVCCTSACTQLCFACNVSGQLGTCTALAAGQDPASECPAEAPATCGRSGGCNGAGACRRHPSGTVCAAASCSGSTLTGASRCNGQGACVAAASSDCGRYLCSGAACGTSCSSSSQCKAGSVCAAPACVAPCSPESNGGFCARLGKTCGSVTASDNCGASRTVTSCGTCAAPQTCGGAGTANVCGTSAPTCVAAYGQGNCVGYSVGARVSAGGHNWTCTNGNCANCATNAGCAPGGTGCPWGSVWSDDGACR